MRLEPKPPAPDNCTAPSASFYGPLPSPHTRCYGPHLPTVCTVASGPDTCSSSSSIFSTNLTHDGPSVHGTKNLSRMSLVEEKRIKRNKYNIAIDLKGIGDGSKCHHTRNCVYGEIGSHICFCFCFIMLPCCCFCFICLPVISALPTYNCVCKT